MKTAIVHDWLLNPGGAEKTLAAIHTLFPAPVYTLFHSRDTARAVLGADADVRASFLQRLPGAARLYRNYLPLYPRAVESFDLSPYDLILSSSHAVAKGAKTRPDQLHICYCYTPMRYAWDQYSGYMAGLDPLRRSVASIVLASLRRWDRSASSRVSRFIASSRYVADRIRRAYGRSAEVIYPPVDVSRFPLQRRKESHFVTVSRLVPYKRLDLIVATFTRLGLPLVVIGDGPERERVRVNAGKNIEFLGAAPFAEMRRAVSTARGFVFMADEDFGIAPVEALACGTPVVAYGRGGVTETIVDGLHGVLFDEQTSQSLEGGLRRMIALEERLDAGALRLQAERFSKERFDREFRDYVENCRGRAEPRRRERDPVAGSSVS